MNIWTIFVLVISVVVMGVGNVRAYHRDVRSYHRGKRSERNVRSYHREKRSEGNVRSPQKGKQSKCPYLNGDLQKTSLDQNLQVEQWLGDKCKTSSISAERPY